MRVGVKMVEYKQAGMTLDNTIDLMQLHYKTKWTWCRQPFWVTKSVAFGMAKKQSFICFLQSV